MLTFFRRTRSCRVLLVEKTDRLYRNLKDWVSVDDLDLEIHLVKENVALSPGSRSTEKFMHGIKVLMAKNYIDNLSEETQKGLREKAEQGFYPSWGPIGYRNADGPNGKRVIEPDPAVAPLLVRLFENYATGNSSLKDATRLARQWGLTFRSGTPISKSVTHKILRNPIYMGRFRWAGIEYQGVHKPLVSLDLWEAVQQRLDGRCAIGTHPVKHQFAFSGLISCGHCGCALVGEIKKGRYIYYHCTGYKQKCPEPYTREEVLAERFAQLLKGLELDAEVTEWVANALRESHTDEKRERDHAVDRLQSEYNRIQARLDAMYLDKLDGRIEAAFFDRKAADWRREQDGLLRHIAIQQGADQNYVEDGIQLLELASEAHQLFLEQKPEEKRRLLGFLVGTASWKDGELSASLRPPFDLIREGVAAAGAQTAAAIDGVRSRTHRGRGLSNFHRRPVSNSKQAFAIHSRGKMANWLPYADSNYPGGPSSAHVDTCGGQASCPSARADSTAEELQATASGYYAGGGTQPFSGASGQSETVVSSDGTLTVTTHSEVQSFVIGDVSVSKVVVDTLATATNSSATADAHVVLGSVTANRQPVAVTDQGVTVQDKTITPCPAVPTPAGPLPGGPVPSPSPGIVPSPPALPGAHEGCVPGVDITYIKIFTVDPTKTVDGTHGTAQASGLHILVTHPSPGPGVPTQSVEYILGEGYADAGTGSGSGGGFNRGSFGFGGPGDFGFNGPGADNGGLGNSAANVAQAIFSNRWWPLVLLFLTLEALLFGSAAAWVWARNAPVEEVSDEVLSP